LAPRSSSKQPLSLSRSPSSFALVHPDFQEISIETSYRRLWILTKSAALVGNNQAPAGSCDCSPSPPVETYTPPREQTQPANQAAPNKNHATNDVGCARNPRQRRRLTPFNRVRIQSNRGHVRSYVRPEEMLPLRIPPQTPNHAHAERQHTEDDLKRDRRTDADLPMHSGQRAYKDMAMTRNPAHHAHGRRNQMPTERTSSPAAIASFQSPNAGIGSARPGPLFPYAK
jgi:hypothetical protein